MVNNGATNQPTYAPRHRATDLAAQPITLNTAPRHTHDDHVCRVGHLLAWQCSTCQRIEPTTTVIGQPWGVS